MITRTLINKGKKKACLFFNREKKKDNNSKIYLATKDILRSKNFVINYSKIFDLLKNIDFFYEDQEKHWAETDGLAIFINSYYNKLLKDNKRNRLTNILIHESLHNVILRNGRHILYEDKEHQIMERINRKLIYI